jgi:hypothetical protein
VRGYADGELWAQNIVAEWRRDVEQRRLQKWLLRAGSMERRQDLVEKHGKRMPA